MCVIRTCKTSSDKQTNSSTKWLENRFSDKTGYTISLYDHKFRPVHDFMLIWNIFERDIINKLDEQNNNYHRVDYYYTFAGKYLPNMDSLNTYYDYVKNVYTNPNKGSHRFRLLLLDKYEDIVKGILLSDSPSGIQKNQACILIALRYRNNLFHGNKELADIINDVELFEKTNAYLIAYIDEHLTIKSE